MAVSKRLRFEILRRDQFRCRYCGLKAEAVELRVDHVIPEALGGTDEPSNLVAACEPCNNGKSSIAPDSPLVDQVAEDAERWARAMEVVARYRKQENEYRTETLQWFENLWNRWKCKPSGNTEPAPDGFSSVITFLDAGLTYDQLEELVEVAMGANHIAPANRWKYFCGCCWARVRENASMAGDAIECGLAEPTAAARG